MLTPSWRRLFTGVLGLLLSSGMAGAQTLKNVFGSSVRAGSQAIEYRMGYTDDRGNGNWGFSQRIHYQRAFSERLRLRGILSQRAVKGENLEFRAFRLETLYQVIERANRGFDGAFRLDMQFEEGDNQPGFIRLSWAMQVPVSETIRLRAIFQTGRDWGPGAEADLFSEIRLQAQYSPGGSFALGVDSFHSFGYWQAMGSFDEQNHLLGPYLSVEVSDALGARFQYLAGLSDSAIDSQFRVFFDYGF